MPEGGVEVRGTVLESLPNALYRVQILTDPRQEITAHVGGGALLRLLPGHEVTVRLMPYDATRGRIVSRAEG